MNNRKIMAPLVGVLVVLGLFAGCGGHAGEKEFSKGMAAWKDGDLPRARALFEKSIRKTSGGEQKALAFNQLGLVLWGLGETAAAAEAFNNSCNFSEELGGANLNLGVALYHAGRRDEAELALNSVLGADPQNATARALLGMIRMDQGDWQAATRELSRAATLHPDAPAVQNALALAEAQHDPAQGITRLTALAAAHPDYAPAAFNLGGLYEHYQRDQSAALGWYEHYLAQAPKGGQADAARRAVTRLGGTASGPTDGPRHDTQAAARYLAAASKLHRNNQYAEAIELYQKAIAADPTQHAAHLYLARACFSAERYSEAAAAYEETLNLSPNLTDAQYMLSLSYCRLGEWNDAERAANELRQTDPERGRQMLDYIAKMRRR